MLFSFDRRDLRRAFVEAWNRHKESRPLEPLQAIIVGVIRSHPEYHRLLEDDEAAERDFSVSGGETNPFLHMAMHIAIQEQVSADRPAGIRALYSALVRGADEAHGIEHAMMECLGRILWESQRHGVAPDESGYLECIRGLERRARRTRR